MARPKKKGERFPSGDLKPVIDRGTDELTAKRLLLTAGNDPALSCYPLGVLLARKVITQDQHNAGVAYAGLFWRARGKPFPKAINMGGISGHGEPEGDLARLHNAARQFSSRKLRDIVESVAVYERPHDPRETEHLRLGLDTIAVHLGIMRCAA